jgi:hypothetical protein
MDTVEDIVKKGEEWREKQRLYKQKNNEKIKLQRNSDKSTHNKSKKHTDWYLGS